MQPHAKKEQTGLWCKSLFRKLLAAGFQTAAEEKDSQERVEER